VHRRVSTGRFVSAQPLPDLPHNLSVAQPAAIGVALGVDLSDGSALLAALRENDKIRVLPDDQLEFKVRIMRAGGSLPCRAGVMLQGVLATRQ